MQKGLICCKTNQPTNLSAEMQSAYSTYSYLHITNTKSWNLNVAYKLEFDAHCTIMS